MKTYLGMFKGEAKRIFSLRYLSVSVISMLLIMLLSAITYCRQYGVKSITFYALFEKICMGGFFLELIFIPASFYIVINLSMDLVQKSAYLYIARSNVSAYVIAKIVIGVIFSIIVTEVSLNIFLLIGINSMDTVDREWLTGGVDVYEDILRYNSILYFEIRILYICAAAGFFTAAGMLLTVIIPNKYVAVVSSYMTAIMLEKIQLIAQVPSSIDISSITGGFIRTAPSVLHSVIYIVLFFSSCIAITAIFFIKIMKWRLYGERC
ncbi:MAG: hypothetical protein K2M60_01700 [Lachnospiraceae bacterium]|nr:hypothetical protein [Lachnospiraceae bacterium]MDE6252435.1 hypothetical protein [Lachnospiraceae bacterium]